jgi:hypothetical protein
MVLRCEGCGAEATLGRRPPCPTQEILPVGWRYLMVIMGCPPGRIGNEVLATGVIVCNDPMCAARAVDLTRGADEEDWLGAQNGATRQRA